MPADRRPGSPWWMKVWAHRLPKERVMQAAADYGRAVGAAVPAMSRAAREKHYGIPWPAEARLGRRQLVPLDRFPAGRVRVRWWQDQLGLPEHQVREGFF